LGGGLYSKTGIYGSVQLNTANGVLTYTLNNADPDTNVLGVGASVSDPFTITTIDRHGASAATTVSFATTGTNDLPTISATAPNAILVEAGVGPGNTPLAGTTKSSASLTIGDPDTGDPYSTTRRSSDLLGGGLYS